VCVCVCVCVCVALGTLRAVRMRYIRDLSGSKYFSTLSHKRHDLKKNVIEYKMCFDIL